MSVSYTHLDVYKRQTYYYCVVTHTNENATGTQTAIAISSIAKIEILNAPVLPETSDNSPIGLWIALGLSLIHIYRHRPLLYCR